MARAKVTSEPAMADCPGCGAPTERTRCKSCCDIGGGYLLNPPKNCNHSHRSPIGNHLCVDILFCAYRCGNMDCHWWVLYSRMNSAPKKVGKVVFG